MTQADIDVEPRLQRFDVGARHTIGSLCSGYGGLEMGVTSVLDADVLWHADPDPGARAILAHRWPGTPNLGDITAVDFTTVPRVDIVAAGFPCQDVSFAGLRAGIADGTRSGLWLHVARAIDHLRPSWVVLENVEGILSARADRGLGPTDPDVEAAGRDALRALGCVLGDLAGMGFDAEWCRVAAAEAGAAHRRRRVFVLAWPADAAGVGRERSGSSWDGRPGPEDRDQAPADTGHRPVAEQPRTARWQDGKRAPERREPRSRRQGPALHPWGPYSAAVDRWENAFGFPAPRPTDREGRLSAAAVEWLMGLPAGHVTGVPGLTRTAQLHALGKGVVPAQVALAVRQLLDRATASPQ